MISADPRIKVTINDRVIMTVPLSQVVELYSLSIKQVMAIQMAAAKGDPLPPFKCNDLTVELELAE